MKQISMSKLVFLTMAKVC